MSSSKTEFKEIETKYRADDISLTEFSQFCEKRSSGKFHMASGWDHFYSSSEDSNQFGRHRIGSDFNQLTVKRKTCVKNNFIRDEDNLDFKESLSREKVQSFFLKFGYSLKKSIFKNCFIYKYPTHTLVYYVIYTPDLKEVGRFIEIEMAEDKDWVTDESAWDALLELEKECRVLGITPQGRVKKSLYELICE